MFREILLAVSQSNVDVVREVFAAFGRGDMEGVLRLCDEPIVITQPAELPGAPPQQRGHQGVLDAMALWPEQWDDYRVELLRITPARGDKVFAQALTHGRGKQSGVKVEMEFSFIFILRDGQIGEWQLFLGEEEALEAAGLSK